MMYIREDELADVAARIAAQAATTIERQSGALDPAVAIVICVGILCLTVVICVALATRADRLIAASKEAE